MEIRSNLLKMFLLVLAVVTTSITSSAGHNIEEPPNVILILVDDLGYGDLSFYGQNTLSTPIIDKMTSEGIHFTNMYTGSTVCAPSRASLMTGKHTGHCSVRGNGNGQLVGDEELTLAKVFKNVGYVTGAIGKWGIGHPPPLDDPQKKGFDYFYGYINMMHAHNFFPEFLYENGIKVPLKNKIARVNGKNPWDKYPEGTGVASVKEEYVHDLFDRKALDFLDKNRENKFFLYMAYNAPHANNEGGSFCGDGMEAPNYGEFADKEWPQPEKGFATMIHNLDNSVGLLLNKIAELGLDEKTMVIFCSDNGPHSEGRHQMEFFNSNGDYRGKKRDLYEGGIKTPFIVRWPGTIQAGTKSEQTQAFWDLLPTFSELVNTNKPSEIDGISFLPSLLGKTQKEEHDYLYWEFYEGGGKQALIKKNWKAIRRNVCGPKENVKLELYNLKTDPEEKIDVAQQYPELVRELEGIFKNGREEFSCEPLFEREVGKQK